MVTVLADVHLGQLARLDVVDVRADGTLALNATFVDDCRSAYAADPSILDTVIATQILKRALAQEIVVQLDVDAATLAALAVDDDDVGADETCFS